MSSSPADPSHLSSLSHPPFPHTADSHIHTHTHSCIQPHPCTHTHPRAALRTLPFFFIFPHLSISRPVLIISVISLGYDSFCIVLICKSKFSIAAGAESGEREREKQREGGRDERTRIIRCLADSLWILAIISAVQWFLLFFLLSTGRVRDILPLSML